MLLWKWLIVNMDPRQSLSFQFCDGAKVMSIPKKIALNGDTFVESIKTKAIWHKTRYD